MNGHLPEKLLRFETPPPPGVWEKITVALDNGGITAQRLHDYKEQPAPQNWKAIEARLAKGAGLGKVIIMPARKKAYTRYLAAASLLFLVALGGMLLLHQTESGSASSGTPSVAQNQSLVPGGNRVTAGSGLASVPASVQDIPKRERGVMASFKRSLAAIRPQNIFPSLSIGRRFIPREANEVSAFNFASADKLMVYCDADGMAMKLPKKLFSLVNCPDGDESCRERIQSLQQKLAASTGPADFVGMLDMVRQLQ